MEFIYIQLQYLQLTLGWFCVCLCWEFTHRATRNYILGLYYDWSTYSKGMAWRERDKKHHRNLDGSNEIPNWRPKVCNESSMSLSDCMHVCVSMCVFI